MPLISLGVGFHAVIVSINKRSVQWPATHVDIEPTIRSGQLLV